VDAVPTASARTEGRRALLVEDEAPIRTLLSRLVARRDYEIVEASSYADARAALDSRRFDLVLCDVRLSDGSGADLLRQVRTSQPELARRFVFVTGDVAALAGQEFAGTPALNKPFSAADLDRVLNEIDVTV
jgi:CheY-like chemotaxis protein